MVPGQDDHFRGLIQVDLGVLFFEGEWFLALIFFYVQKGPILDYIHVFFEGNVEERIVNNFYFFSDAKQDLILALERQSPAPSLDDNCSSLNSDDIS